MKKRMINSTRIEGTLYQHSLELKVSGPNSKKPGTEFISGAIEIATNNAMTNIVPVHFTYVVATTKQGKENATFTTLKNIIDKKIGCYTDPEVGDKAAKVRVDSTIGLMEFYSDRNGKEELVSAKRNEGGFISIVSAINPDENARNTFEIDMLLNGTRLVEADEERNLPEYLLLKGVAFNFKNDILPIELPIRDPNGIQYFQNLGITKDNMIFTKVWGHVVSNQTKVVKTEEAAFGEDKVVEYTRTHKEWLVENTLKVPYELGDAEAGITVDELKKAVENRNIYLADVKKRQEDYQATKAAAAPAAQAGVSAAMGGFNF
jgi:hypothetical protein